MSDMVERAALDAALVEAEQLRGLLAEVSGLLCGVRIYACRHGLPIGECVAWVVLKQLAGVGSSNELDELRWSTYRQRLDTMYAHYKRRKVRAG